MATQVDFEIVWKTIQGDLPALYAQVQKAFADLPGNDVNEGMPP